MTQILLTSFLIAAIVFALFIVPKVTADIARDAGVNEAKWYFYSTVFNVAALMWLYTSLGPKTYRRKIFLATLIAIYVIIFYGAYAIDKYVRY